MGCSAFTAFLHQLLSKIEAQDYDICFGTPVPLLHGKFMALSSNNIEACWESGIAGKGLWCWRLVAEGSMGLAEERS